MVVRFYHWDPSMTLATVILLINFPWMAPRMGLMYQSASPAAPATQDQGAPPAEAAPKDAKPASAPATAAQKPSATGPQQAKKPVRRKPAAASNCDAGAPGTSGSKPSPAPATSAAKPSPPASGTPPKSCPPSKIIVRQGGASDSSIQLAGGPSGGGRSQQMNATTQLLGITEDNLKKLDGQQLDTHQQDSVTQIREYVEQSKKSLALGDPERAHTLAWKAEVLSEDLVKPAK
jgi:hypothetical protein